MKDFGQWFKEQTSASVHAQAHIEALEEAGIIFAMKDGSYHVECCCCGNITELPVGPDEIDLDYEHYCGGSPRCCP